jgi:hypothetical protein
MDRLLDLFGGSRPSPDAALAAAAAVAAPVSLETRRYTTWFRKEWD